jgi:hypothetical protein
MKKSFCLLCALLLGISEISFAHQMSGRKAQCEGLKDLYQTQSKWKADYFRFRDDQALSEGDRFEVSYKGAQKIVFLIERMEALAGMRDSEPLLRDAHRLFSAIENNNISKRTAQNVLTNGLVRLSDKMTDVVLRAQSITNCELTPITICENPDVPCPQTWIDNAAR